MTKAGIANLSPCTFAASTNRNFLFPPHLELINKALLDLVSGNISRLGISLPPRHGKSELCSKYFPAWYVASQKKRFILATYGATFAQSWGRKARELIRKWGSLIWGVELRRDVSSAADWQIETPDEEEAGMYCCGVGGPVTGRGAHIIGIDDPIKNAQESRSKTTKDGVWDWYRSTIESRLEPGGGLFLIATRWAIDDLTGRIQDEEGEKWTFIDLPALAKEDDLLGREEGEALWTVRYPVEALTEMQERSPYWFSSLYQQNPSLQGGEIVKEAWIERHNAGPAQAWAFQFQSWDLRGEGQKTDVSSYVVGQVWGVKEGQAFLLDQVRGQWDFVETIDAFLRMSKEWPKSRAKLVEDKASGRPLITVLKKKIPGMIPVEPKGDKVTRFEAVAPLFQAGNIFIPQSAPWVKEWIEEITCFPSTSHNDQVDATSQALAYFAERVNRRPVGVLSGLLDEPGGVKKARGRWKGWL